MEEMEKKLVAYDMPNGITYVGKTDISHTMNENRGGGEVTLEEAVMIGTKFIMRESRVEEKIIDLNHVIVKEYTNRAKLKEPLKLKISNRIGHYTINLQQEFKKYNKPKEKPKEKRMIRSSMGDSSGKMLVEGKEEGRPTGL